MTSPEMLRMLYSNFYTKGSPRFAYPIESRRTYMTKKAYAGNCTEARSGSFCTDNIGARCYKLGANSYNCAGSSNDKGLSDDQIKTRGQNQGANTGSATPGSGGVFGGGGLGDMLKNPWVIGGIGAAVIIIIVVAIM